MEKESWKMKWPLAIASMICIPFLLIQKGISQDTLKNPAYFAFKPQYGFIIPHSITIRDVSGYNPYGLETEFGWHLTGANEWNRCNCYSKAGFSLLHANYNAPDVLGSSTNLIAFAEPFFNYKGWVMTSLRMGVGISYLSETYDAETNPENLFFSSPVSFLVHIDLNLTRFISDQWFVQAYFKYNHISNGGVEEPNKGMNFPTYGMGLGYSFHTPRFTEREKKALERPTPLISSLHTFGTIRNSAEGEETSRHRPAVGMAFKMRKNVSRINALNLGLEGILDFATREKIEKEGLDRDYKQFSLLLGHDFVFGKFIFSQYWGTYLYAPYYPKKNFFQRYSLTYNLFHRFRLGVTLKAHAEVAENFNVLVSYDLR